MSKATAMFYVPSVNLVVPENYYLKFLTIESDASRKQAIGNDPAFQAIAAGECWKFTTVGDDEPNPEAIKNLIASGGSDGPLYMGDKFKFEPIVSIYRMML